MAVSAAVPGAQAGLSALSLRAALPLVRGAGGHCSGATSRASHCSAQR